MVIYDKYKHTCRLYEIKHSTEIAERQMCYLRDGEKCKIIEARFGMITGRYVLYRGENKTVDNVQYLNVEQFLCEEITSTKMQYLQGMFRVQTLQRLAEGMGMKLKIEFIPKS